MKAAEFFNQRIQMGAMSDIGHFAATTYFVAALELEQKDSPSVFPCQIDMYQDLRKLGAEWVIIDHLASDRLLYGPCSRCFDPL